MRAEFSIYRNEPLYQEVKAMLMGVSSGYPYIELFGYEWAVEMYSFEADGWLTHDYIKIHVISKAPIKTKAKVWPNLLTSEDV